MPSAIRTHVECSLSSLEDITNRLPWTLTHHDLSSMNLLFNPATGNLTGVVDWADSLVCPFGKDLWGLESVLGWEDPDGLTRFDDETCWALFRETFVKEVGHLPADTLNMIERSRVMGLLLRYGFIWDIAQNGLAPVHDFTLLEAYLDRKCD